MSCSLFHQHRPAVPSNNVPIRFKENGDGIPSPGVPYRFTTWIGEGHHMRAKFIVPS